jgi:hypothetical protein
MASVSYHKVINWHLSAVLAVIIFIVINYQILLGEENVHPLPTLSCGRDRVVVYNNLCNQCLSPLVL